MDKPTVQALDTCLRDVTKAWKSFALNLPGIDLTKIYTIERDSRDDIVEQKIAVYDKWLRVYPNASWDDVIKALETAEENTIAKQLREKYPTKRKQKSSADSIKDISPSSPSSRAVTVQEKVLTKLNTLHQSFLDLACNVESEFEGKVENGDLEIKTVVRRIEQEQAFPIPSLDSVKTSNQLFKAIRPHYNFLNCYLLVSIALHLSGTIAEKATEHKEKVKEFMKTKKIRSLQNILKRYSRMYSEHSDATVVEIVVENGWGDQNVWLVKMLVKFLFPVKHPDELPWYDIVPGSVVLTFIALEQMTSFLIQSSRKKIEFMRLIGVISLKVGDELIWKKEDEASKTPFSFDNSLVQATFGDNIEAVQFLLQYTQVNVNIKNTTIPLIDTVDEQMYLSKKILEYILKSKHATFIALLKDVEYEFQYVQDRMTAVSNDSTDSSSPVADDGSNYNSIYLPHNNFLNGSVLSGLSNQLPEPLSTQVKQYQAEIDKLTKRKSMISHFNGLLEKFFPIAFPTSIKVILTLQSVWSTCSIWYVEQLGHLLFTPTLFHKLQWFRVDTSEESLRVVLLADKKLMDSLTKESLGKDKSLTSLFGIISVRVDDTVVLSNDHSNGYTFNGAIELAKRIGKDKMSDLLLQIQQSPVDFNRFREPDSNNNRHFLPEPDSTPLMIACCNHNSQLVQLLLDHNADSNIQCRNNYTALMYSTGNSKIFQMLLDHGADINKVTFFNETVLHFACNAGNVKVVKTVLPRNRGLVHQATDNGWTPLMGASKYGHMEIVKILLQEKADPNIQDYEGWTALERACRYGHTAVVHQLLQAKAQTDLNIQNTEGQTALMKASGAGHKAVVKLLLHASADLNIRDNKGRTALMEARVAGHTAVVELFVQACKTTLNI